MSERRGATGTAESEVPTEASELDGTRALRHRARNDFQVIQSLLRLQARRTAIPATARSLEANVRRVRIIAFAYDHADRSGFRVDMTRFVQRIVAEQQPAHVDATARCIMDEGIELPMSLATPCGLIIGELLANCIEHGLKDAGEALVRLARRDGRCRLTVRDNGPGFDPAVEHTGTFGLTLCRLMASQLGGNLVVHSAPGQGARVEVTFPSDGGDLA